MNPAGDTWCWPFSHDWAKWQEATYRTRSIVAGVAVGEPESQLFQRRECKRCGLQQTRPL